MRIGRSSFLVSALVVFLGFIGVLPITAQNGKLKVKATPAQAYVFVDGQAMGQAYHPLQLSAGNHRVDVVNYGYKTFTKDVSISDGTTMDVEATLEPISDTVSGPWGCLTIEDSQRDAIFLNGKTPEYFVGHGDEFNHEFGMKQELLVPPGTHQLLVVRQGKEVFSGSVDVPENQRVVIDIPKGVRKTVPWPRGQKLSPAPRFKAGIASAQVAIAKPTADISAQTQPMTCGEGAQIKWNATDAGHVEITPIGEVSASGEQAVQPNQTTTYNLKASGPGGVVNKSTTVNVNTGIQAQLTLSPAEVHFRRVGDKITEQPSSQLNWSTANASAVSIDAFGSVSPSDSKPLQIAPRKTDAGPIDETVTYTLTASNACGATETRTASLHITGEIVPESNIAMRSIYFSTDKPKADKLAEGISASQQQTLTRLAADFKAYLDAHPDAQFILHGYADVRGSKNHNQSLSERRAEAAKNILIQEGIAAEKIQVRGYGEEQQLTKDEVKQMLAANAEANEAARNKALRQLNKIVYAHNRRVDVELSTTAQKSVQTYPFAANDYAMLVK